MSAPIIAITMATDSLQHLNVAHLSDSIKNLHRPLARAAGRLRPTSPLAATGNAIPSKKMIASEESFGDGPPPSPPSSPSATPPRPRKFSSLSPAFSFSRFGSLKQLTRQVSCLQRIYFYDSFERPVPRDRAYKLRITFERRKHLLKGIPDTE